jgi:hypothetical protein
MRGSGEGKEKKKEEREEEKRRKNKIKIKKWGRERKVEQGGISKLIFGQSG